MFTQGRFRAPILLLALLLAAPLLVPQAAGATVGGYVELHGLACPAGYDPDHLFDSCHGNRLAGITFVATGPGDLRYEGATDERGRVVFGEYFETGRVTIAEYLPNPDFADFYVYCSRVGTAERVAVTKHQNGRAAFSIEIPDAVAFRGEGIVCDWYNLPAGGSGLPTATPESGFISGGIGISRDSWERAFGPGVETDEMVTYGGGWYTVRYDSDVAIFIERTWSMSDGNLTDARSAVSDLVPLDAVLTNVVLMPATASGPIPVLIEYYDSRLLAQRLDTLGEGWSGAIVVLYQLIPGTEPNASAGVTMISVAAARRP